MENYYLLYIFLSTVLIVLSGIIGYILGRISSNNGVIQYGSSRPKSFFEKESSQEVHGPLEIDSKKFVTDIKTDGMERKYDSLGDTKVSDENITDSISKLKNMKR